jgi:phage portal protein BeeE
MLKQLTGREQQLRTELDAKSGEREFNLNELVSLQNRSRRYMELKSGKYAFAVKDAELRPLELEKQRLRSKQIVQIVQELENDYADVIRPTLKDVGLKGLTSLAEKA